LKFPSFSIGEVWKELHRFQSLDEKKRSIVFYAENKASMNHFKGLIFELSENMNLNICYVTSVKDDFMLSVKQQNLESFYIGEGAARTKFFLTLNTKILIMDMPDLEKFHIKRSKVYPVHYIYIFHSMFSIHSYLREGALDHYDTIFCVGPHHVNEIKETEKFYNLKPKELISYGFPRLDTLIKEKENLPKEFLKSKNLILIAPSYGENNLLEVCGIELINILLKSNFKVFLRPHFKILKESKNLIEEIIKEFGNNPNFSLEKGIIPSDIFNSSLCMISDWSGISLEYAFTFEQPVFFIDVPKKILNINSNSISLEPIEISIRHDLGYVISVNDLEKIPSLITESNDQISKNINSIRNKTVYNIGKSSLVGAEYIKNLRDNL
tara:strand:- start:2539 stop:3684 length:1146 start_codon:yes stop_codon:yes gene_type:complete